MRKSLMSFASLLLMVIGGVLVNNSVVTTTKAATLALDEKNPLKAEEYGSYIRSLNLKDTQANKLYTDYVRKLESNKTLSKATANKLIQDFRRKKDVAKK